MNRKDLVFRMLAHKFNISYMPVVVTDGMVELMKDFYSREEAWLLVLMPLMPVSAKTIARLQFKNPEKVEKMLLDMVNRGLLIEFTDDGVQKFQMAPFIPGVAEMTLMKGEDTPESRRYAKKMHDLLEDSSSRVLDKIDAMDSFFARVIPVNQGLSHDTQTLPYEDVIQADFSSACHLYDPEDTASLVPKEPQTVEAHGPKRKLGDISQQIVDLLLTWNHHSGFNVHARGRINGADRKAIENVARYMSRAAISVERVRYNRAQDSVTVTKKPFGSSPEESRSYPVGDFLALLVSHIPAPYESLIYYYGVYSSSYRGKQRRENKEEQETERVLIDTAKGTADGKPTSTWARLIRRIFEVDPLRCRKCGVEMRIIAFVTGFRQISRILEHVGEQTIRPPPLTAKTSPPTLSRAEAVDYIPDLDAYVQDPIYPD